jgi:hypothetical protein
VNRILVAALAVSLLSANSAQALEISVRGAHTDPRRTLHLTGSIEPGDASRIRMAVRALPPGTRLIGLTVSSDGGDVGSSLELIELVDELNVPLLVRGWCASACGFWAAGVAAHHRLYLAREADVRVHRDYDEHGVDDLADSLRVANILKKRGVPASVCLKIVNTPSSELANITSDLIAMGARTD